MGIVRRTCSRSVRRRALSVPTCVRTGKSVGLQEQHPCPRSCQRQHRSGTRSSAAQLSDSSTRPSSHTCLPDLFQRQSPARAARLGQLITLVHAVESTAIFRLETGGGGGGTCEVYPADRPPALLRRVTIRRYFGRNS